MSTAYLVSIEVLLGVSLLAVAWVFRGVESRLGYLLVVAMVALFPAVGVPLGVGLLLMREVFSAFVVGMLLVGFGGAVGAPSVLFWAVALVGAVVGVLRGRGYPVSIWLLAVAFVVFAWGVWPFFTKLGVDINRYVFFAERGFSQLYFAFLLYVRGLGLDPLDFVGQWVAAVFILPFAYFDLYRKLTERAEDATWLRAFVPGVPVLLVWNFDQLVAMGYVESWISSSPFWVYPYTISLLSASMALAGPSYLHVVSAALFHVGGPVYIAAALLFRWIYSGGVDRREAATAALASAAGLYLNTGSLFIALGGLLLAGVYLLNFVKLPEARWLRRFALAFYLVALVGWLLGWNLKLPFAYVTTGGLAAALFPLMLLLLLRGDYRDAAIYLVTYLLGILLVATAGLLGFVVLSNDRLIPLAVSVLAWRASALGVRVVVPLGVIGVLLFGALWVVESPTYEICNGVVVADTGSSYPLLWGINGLSGGEAIALFRYKYPLMPALYLKSLGNASLCLYKSVTGHGFLYTWNITSTEEMGLPAASAPAGVLADDVSLVYKVATSGVPYVVVHPADIYVRSSREYLGNFLIYVVERCPASFKVPPGYWRLLVIRGSDVYIDGEEIHGGIAYRGVALPELSVSCRSGWVEVLGERVPPEPGAGYLRPLPLAGYFPPVNVTKGVYIDRFDELYFRGAVVYFLSGVVEEVDGSRVYQPVRGGVVYAEEIYVKGGEYTYPRLVMRGVVYNGSLYTSLTLLARLPNITAAYVESGIYRGRNLTCYFAIYDTYVHCFDVAADALAYRRLRFDPPIVAELRQNPLYFLAPPLLAPFLSTRRVPYLLLLLATSGVLWFAHSSTLATVVPSGDDPAVHVYIAQLVVVGETPYFWHSQYPNAIHLFLAWIYGVSKSPIVLITVFKWLAFSLVIAGLALYFLYFRLIHRDNKLAALATVVALSTWTGVLHTLADGSVMELVYLLIGLPTSLYLAERRRPLAAGVVAGFAASQSYLGLLHSIPTSLLLLLRDGRRYLIGYVIGGNLFLFKLLYGAAVEQFGGAGAYSYSHLFHALSIYHAVYIVPLLAAVVLYGMRKTAPVAVYIWPLHFLLSGAAAGSTEVAARLARADLAMLGLSAGSALKKLGPAYLVALIALLYMAFAMWHIPVVHRLDEHRLFLYLSALEAMEPNSVLVALPQISTWALPLFFDPGRNITAYLIYPNPDLKNPKTWVGLQIIEKLEAGEAPGAVYLLVESPRPGEWYTKDVLDIIPRIRSVLHRCTALYETFFKCG